LGYLHLVVVRSCTNTAGLELSASLASQLGSNSARSWFIAGHPTMIGLIRRDKSILLDSLADSRELATRWSL